MWLGRKDWEECRTQLLPCTPGAYKRVHTAYPTTKRHKPVRLLSLCQSSVPFLLLWLNFRSSALCYSSVSQDNLLHTNSHDEALLLPILGYRPRIWLRPEQNLCALTLRLTTRSRQHPRRHEHIQLHDNHYMLRLARTQDGNDWAQRRKHWQL
jgi:hypothetical protein